MSPYAALADLLDEMTDALSRQDAEAALDPSPPAPAPPQILTADGWRPLQRRSRP